MSASSEIEFRNCVSISELEASRKFSYHRRFKSVFRGISVPQKMSNILENKLPEIRYQKIPDTIPKDTIRYRKIRYWKGSKRLLVPEDGVRRKRVPDDKVPDDKVTKVSELQC